MEILFNMVANKKEIGGLNEFEGLLKYYVKLTRTQIIEQWATPKLYNELILKMFSSRMTPLNKEKEFSDFQYVYSLEEKQVFFTGFYDWNLVASDISD